MSFRERDGRVFSAPHSPIVADVDRLFQPQWSEAKSQFSPSCPMEDVGSFVIS